MAREVKAKKDVAVSLETVLWNCRVALRGVGTTEKNRDAVIGLVFLKFAGDKFEKRRKELIEQYVTIYNGRGGIDFEDHPEDNYIIEVEYELKEVV